MDRMVKVTGKGKVSIKPDMIRLTMELCDVCESYEKTLQKSSDQVNVLKKIFEGLGFQGSDVKTTYFNVDTKYESYKDWHNDYKQKFIGYEFKHNLKLEFNADNKLLGKILYALAHGPVRPKFQIMYTVKDSETAKNELIRRAVANSKDKAAVLAEAAGVELKQIVTIDYSWAEMNLFVRPANRILAPMAAMECDRGSGSYEIDIEPENIEVTDTVTVVWEIM